MSLISFQSVGAAGAHDADRPRRRAVALAGFAALEDGTTFAISVIDLSYAGCRVETALAVLPGVQLKISIPGLSSAVRAVVRWCSNGHAGLKFETNVTPVTPRRYQREGVDAFISLRRSGRHHHRARIFDLTPNGCRVEFIELPGSQEKMWAKFDGLEALESIVRWRDGPCGGLQFVRPLHPAVFDMLLARLKSGGG